MHKYLRLLQELLEQNADEQIAVGMKQYMRNQFDFYGIQSPLRKELFSRFYKENGLPDKEIVDDIAEECWQQPQREFQYFGMEMLKKIAKKADKERIKLYEFTIVNKSWWDTVDFIAANLVGTHFKMFPEFIEPYTSKWINSGNMWLQRTAILFQLKYKRDTDVALLAKIINKMQGSDEFFINKAVGWALREYSKTDAIWVSDFTKQVSLHNLSKKEALKWLNAKIG